MIGAVVSRLFSERASAPLVPLPCEQAGTRLLCLLAKDSLTLERTTRSQKVHYSWKVYCVCVLKLGSTMALSPLWTVSASEQTGRRTAATKRSCVGESRSRGLSLVSPDTDDENSLVAAGSDIDNPIHRGRAGTQVMASTLVKGKLKAAREAISSKDFVKAEKAAR